eukprot:scaffold37301_cov47-Attheya_sp.AAC.4
MPLYYLNRTDRVNADEAIRVSGEKGGSVGGPGEAGALGDIGGGGSILVEFISRDEGGDNNLALQIPDLDVLVRGGAEPVAVGGKDQGIDNLTSIERVETLAFIQIPKHGSSVLASGGTERTIGRDTDSVKVSGVSHEVVAKLAGGEGPDLDEAIPSSRDNERHALGRGETDTGDPLSVALALSGGDGVLALSEGVPKLDGLVATGGDNLTVVDAEGNTENILLVANKAAGGHSGADLPKAKSSVPRSGQSELSVGADDNVGDKVRVSLEAPLGLTVRAIGGVGQLPSDHRLVAAGRQHKVGVLAGGGDAGHPVVVAREGSAKCKRFSHC